MPPKIQGNGTRAMPTPETGAVLHRSIASDDRESLRRNSLYGGFLTGSPAERNFSGITITNDYSAMNVGGYVEWDKLLKNAQEFRDKDGTAYGSYKLILGLILGANWSIAVEEDADDETSEIRDFVQWSIGSIGSSSFPVGEDAQPMNHVSRNHGFYQCREALHEGFIDGLSLLEIDWQRRTWPENGVEYWVPAALHPIHPGRIRFDADGRMVPIKTGKEESNPLPWGKFVSYVYDARYGSPHGFGVAFKCRYWMFFKRQLQIYAMRYASRIATPLVSITAPESVENVESWRKQWVTVLENLPNSMGLALDNGEVLNIIESTKTPSDIFSKLIDYCDRQMATIILGNPQAIGLDSTGTYGSQQAGKESVFEAVEAHLRREMHAWQTYLIEPLILFNFGADAVRPRFTLDTSRDVDINPQIAAITALTQMGLGVRLEEVYDRLGGFSVPAQGDVVTRPPEPGASFPSTGQEPNSQFAEVAKEVRRLQRELSRSPV